MHDGLIILWKAPGISSARALYRVRKITGVRKSGHAGTLDPAAEGILIICQGRATRLVERIMDLPKVYRATARLDQTSESLDSDSEMTPVPVARRPTEAEILGTMRKFEGTIDQAPPKISAVKIGGVPAYRLARQGRAFEPKKRQVRIDWIRLEQFEWPSIAFETRCGRGTYVRSLVRDLGAAMGLGGCLTSLVRSAVGPFDRSWAWTVERLQSVPDPSESVVSIDRFLSLVEHATAGSSLQA